jgi:hypothetical protein
MQIWICTNSKGNLMTVIEGYEDDPQELEKDRIEGVLNKLLDAKQITAEQYERALKDPDYCYQLEAKFKGI